jgi:hypothetical protein
LLPKKRPVIWISFCSETDDYAPWNGGNLKKKRAKHTAFYNDAFYARISADDNALPSNSFVDDLLVTDRWKPTIFDWSHGILCNPER